MKSSNKKIFIQVVRPIADHMIPVISWFYRDFFLFEPSWIMEIHLRVLTEFVSPTKLELVRSEMETGLTIMDGTSRLVRIFQFFSWWCSFPQMKQR